MQFNKRNFILKYFQINTLPSSPPPPPAHLRDKWQSNSPQSHNAKKKSDVSKNKHYLNQAAFNELLISREKPMIDFRKHHLISQVRSKVEVQR